MARRTSVNFNERAAFDAARVAGANVFEELFGSSFSAFAFARNGQFFCFLDCDFALGEFYEKISLRAASAAHSRVAQQHQGKICLP